MPTQDYIIKDGSELETLMIEVIPSFITLKSFVLAHLAAFCMMQSLVTLVSASWTHADLSPPLVIAKLASPLSTADLAP